MEIKSNDMPHLLSNAWNNFIKSFDFRYNQYSGGNSAQQWVCWNESDVIGNFTHFLYEEFKKMNITNREIHLNCSLKPNNHSGNFRKKCEKLSKHFEKNILVDMAIAFKDDVPFELCLEAKHFHYKPRNESVEQLIRNDIRRLQAIKKLKIAKYVAFAALDDYYYVNDRRKSYEIKKILNDYKNELIVLFHEAP